MCTGRADLLLQGLQLTEGLRHRLFLLQYPSHIGQLLQLTIELDEALLQPILLLLQLAEIGRRSGY